MTVWTDVRSAGMTALRRARSSRGGAAVVLTYHRIADDPDAAGGLAVAPGRFAEHVAAFAGRYELLTAGELMLRVAGGGALPRRGLCITFDDGYADALTSALPVLERHGAPATVFACTGYLDGGREFWWDELELLMHADDRRAGRFDLAPAALGPLSPRERESVLEQLREHAGLARAVRPDRRPLTRDELRALAASGLVEIGAHTATHPRLAARPFQEQRDEIAGSKRLLEELLDRPVVAFSYPFGTRGSFSAATRRLVREAGFLGAVTTQLGPGIPWGSVHRGSDRFALPRTATADVPAADIVALIDKRLGL